MNKKCVVPSGQGRGGMLIRSQRVGILSCLLPVAVSDFLLGHILVFVFFFVTLTLIQNKPNRKLDMEIYNDSIA